MAKMLKPTEVSRFSHFTVYHLLTSLLVAAVWNARETQGGPASSLNDSMENTDTIIVPQIVDRYEPYYKGMTSALENYDLEYSLDYYSEKALMKEYDFDTKYIVKKLADSAMADNTPPNQFLEEIHDLISLQNRSRAEPDENTARDELTPGFSDSLLKRVTEGWKNELKRLEKKYNVSSECTGRDSVTPTRLALMFPHYLNFGQRPFTVPSEISVYGPKKTSYDPYSYTTTESYYNRKRSTPKSTTSSYYSGSEYKIPAIFKRVEFGGLIPRTQNPDQRLLVALHLYALYGSEQNDVVPFRTKCVMLRRRMEKCVLSDERRKRLLQNNDISEKSAMKKSLDAVYLSLDSSDFTSKIDWSLFDFEQPKRATELLN